LGYFSWLDENSDITAILWRNHKRFRSLSVFTQNVLRGSGEMSIADREFLAAFVSGLNACSFCHGSHKAVAAVYGVDEELLERTINDLESSQISDKLLPIFLMARKLTREPSTVLLSDIDAIRDAGWSEDAIHDAIVICALFNFYNRLLDGHGIKGSPAKSAKGAQVLPKFGYKTPWIARFFLKGGIKKKQRDAG